MLCFFYIACDVSITLAKQTSTIQETWNEGEAKGIIEMGNDFGLSEEDILARLQKKLNVSLQKAQEYLYAYRKQNA